MNDNHFAYNYSAAQQEEIKQIREKYVPQAPDPAEDKMETLRRLDGRAGEKARGSALTLGIVSTLVMGGGMSLALAFDSAWFMPGIAVGLVGIVGVALAFPLYRRVLKKEQERNAPEILRLTEELMQ